MLCMYLSQQFAIHKGHSFIKSLQCVLVSITCKFLFCSKHKKRKHQAADGEPSKKKSKLESSDVEEVKIKIEDEDISTETPSYAELSLRVIPIAKPLASEKLAGKLYKTVRKAAKKKTLRRGVKEVTKSLRKGEKGFTILAGDISPLDVISHIPVYCEEQKVPYVFVPSRYDLGSAALTKRPTSMVLIKQNEEYEKYYKKCLAEITALPHPLL